MVINKTIFFFLLFAVSIFPFVLYKLVWLANSKQTSGQMRFLGHTMEVQGISAHPVFTFTTGKDTVFFNGNFDLGYQPGEIVSVRYQKNNPADAKINSFTGIWLDTVFYVLPQLLILSIIFFTPDKWSPLIPNKSKIVFAKKPLIRIVHGE